MKSRDQSDMLGIRSAYSCIHTVIILVMLFLADGVILSAQSSALGDALYRASQQAQPQNLKPGYGICLFDAKGEIWSSYKGYSDEETRIPFSRNTIFRVGAVSEIFTAMAILQLVDVGLINPEATVGTYLPEVFSGAPAGGTLERIGRLKIRILLSQLSGTDANFFLGFRDYDPFFNLRDYLTDVNLKYPPETKYLRSGAMMDLLGCVAQKVSGKPFAELVETAVFEPLGMDSSSFRYRSSELFASIRYKSAAPDSYATRIPGFREAVAPSGSMQTSLRDLVSFYSALLRMRSETGLLSPESFQAMFSSQSEAVMHRQGLRIGYVWKLTLPELAYLGKVAWYSGKHLSHRNVVILLPDLGIGIVCATNAWSIFDRETILPMALDVLMTYARENLKIPEPPPLIPTRVPLPRQLKTQVSGLYASVYGVYHLQPKGNAIAFSSNTMDFALEYGGQNEFHPGPNGPLEKLTFTPPDSFNLSMRNGMTIEAQRTHQGADDRIWLKRRGTYRISRPQAGAQFAFTLGVFEGLPVISGDDGVELLLDPLSNERAIIRCDESSRFFGKEIRVSGERELLLDGIPYQRTH